MLLDSQLFFTREDANKEIFSPRVALKIPPVSLESKLKALDRIKTLFDRWENESIELKREVEEALHIYFKRGGISLDTYQEIRSML